MSQSTTGNKTHDLAVSKAEAIKQAAIAAATTASTKVAVVEAAEVTMARASVASAITNGVGPSAYLYALAERHQGIYA